VGQATAFEEVKASRPCAKLLAKAISEGVDEDWPFDAELDRRQSGKNTTLVERTWLVEARDRRTDWPFIARMSLGDINDEARA